ncbi:hypothetical protein C8F04DRAFT_1226817 [Mycena alexandri]|uniref:Uncharacterized protein n=1 Tax=Mycena alexandri TaxID=1745969 RepID=A0AAD6XH52_9AGAR|nr:hypothetical protein C8F04DRAFT_1226817 [Mycena alexandri]
MSDQSPQSAVSQGSTNPAVASSAALALKTNADEAFNTPQDIAFAQAARVLQVLPQVELKEALKQEAVVIRSPDVAASLPTLLRIQLRAERLDFILVQQGQQDTYELFSAADIESVMALKKLADSSYDTWMVSRATTTVGAMEDALDAICHDIASTSPTAKVLRSSRDGAQMQVDNSRDVFDAHEAETNPMVKEYLVSRRFPAPEPVVDAEEDNGDV